ncbi:6840_t:CDS:2, partial [Acaulospora morrowiae]
MIPKVILKKNMFVRFSRRRKDDNENDEKVAVNLDMKKQALGRGDKKSGKEKDGKERVYRRWKSNFVLLTLILGDDVQQMDFGTYMLHEHELE